MYLANFFKVSDFTWSHDGTQALISYRDGFVLVGSVSGQRHWSSEINLESQITCGIWTPDDQQVTHVPPSIHGPLSSEHHESFSLLIDAEVLGSHLPLLECGVIIHKAETVPGGDHLSDSKHPLFLMCSGFCFFCLVWLNMVKLSFSTCVSVFVLLFCPDAVFFPLGVVWHCRWAGHSDGLPRAHAGPHSASRVGWDRRHVLELSQFPGGGQQ